MSKCQNCQSMTNHGDTHCGQCGTKLVPTTTNLFATLANTVVAPRPQNNNKKLLIGGVVLAILLLSTFVCGQLTKPQTIITRTVSVHTDNPASGFTLPKPTVIPTQQVLPSPTSVPTVTPTQAPTPIPSPIPTSNYPLGSYSGTCHNNNMNKNSPVSFTFGGTPRDMTGSFTFDESNLYGSGIITTGFFDQTSTKIQFTLDSAGEPYTILFNGEWKNANQGLSLTYIVTNRNGTRDSTGHCYDINQT